MRLLIKAFLASAPNLSPMSSMTCGTTLHYLSLYPEKDLNFNAIVHYYLG
jgi:hypothetical protein